MSDYSIFQVDAFTSEIFRGNPAAVVPLAAWLDETVLQNIAQENNLSETAFFTRAREEDADFHLRWFTPVAEVDLCGHATLAAAHVLFKELGWQQDRVKFSTEQTGIVTVFRCDDDRLQLDFPAWPGKEITIFDEFVQALAARPEQLRLTRDHMAIFNSETEVAAVTPHMARLAKINDVGIIITAPADQLGVDFVSRFFAPHHGIPEDPVTGSAHCSLIPYWAERLGKAALMARQISPRGGDLKCTYLPQEGRVHIAGHAVTYLKGQIFV